MQIELRKRHRKLWLLVSALCLSSFAGLCGTLKPVPNPAHPWTSQPLKLETKQFFCNQLELESNNPVCQPKRDVYAADLVPVLEERFPVNQTLYSEVAKALQYYPVQVEESKLPDGTITSKRYVFLLTEFDGFCVFFSVRDVLSGIVTRIYSSSVGSSGSGPTSDTCTSTEVREKLRPWLK